MIVFFQNKSFFPMPRKYQCPIKQSKVKEICGQTKGKARRACQSTERLMFNKANKG